MGFDVSKDRFGYAGGFEAMSGGADGGTDVTRFFVAEWATDSLVAADNDPIGNWVDGKGSLPVTGAGSARPLYKVGITPSGKPVLRFDGVDDVLLNAAAIVGQHLFMVAAYRPTTTTNQHAPFSGAGAGYFWTTPSYPVFGYAAIFGVALRDGLISNSYYGGGQFAIYEFIFTSPISISPIFGSDRNLASSFGAWDICYLAMFNKKVPNAAANALRTRLTNTYLAPQNLWQNLISYWKLDEASGNAIDAKGVNHLPETAPIAAASGKVNGARHTGGGQYFNLADNASLSTGDIDFSFCAWVNADSLPAYNTIIGKWDAGTKEYLLYYIVGAQFGWAVTPDGATATGIASDIAPTPGSWYFIVAWHDSVANTINIQVNNGPVQSTAHSAGVFDGSSGFNLGFGVDSWNGLIDEVGFWKKVLTPIERTWLYNNGSGRTYDDAQNFIQAAGITDATQQSAIKTLVTDLKTAGIWSKCHAIYPFVGGNATAHKFNLKDSRDLDAAFRLTFSAGWVHAATGITGTSAVADTKYNASINGSRYDSHLSVYVRTDTPAGTKYEIGAYDVGLSSTWLVGSRVTSDKLTTDAYGFTVGNGRIETPTTDARGYYIGNRRSFNVQNQWKNGIKTAPDDTHTESVGLPASATVGIGDVYPAGQFSDREIAFASIGSGLSDADAAAFNTAVQKFQGTLGRAIVPPTLVAHAVAGSPDGDTVTTPPIDTSLASRINLALASNPSNLYTLSDTYGNTWHPLTSYADPFGRIQQWECKNPIVGPGHTFTATGPMSTASIAVQAFSGTDRTANATIENGGAFVGPGPTIQPGSITPPDAGSLVITAFEGEGTGPLSIDSGFIITDQVAIANNLHYQLGMAYKVTSAAVNPTWTNNAANQCAASIAAFKGT